MPKIWPHRNCSASFAACKKFAERHGPKECTSDVLKCVNCSGSHQSGHNTCTEQLKEVERYKTFFDCSVWLIRASLISSCLLSENPHVQALQKCIQINLRHSSLASSFLSQIILDLDVVVVLIQESYVLSSFFLWLQYPPWFLGFSSAFWRLLLRGCFYNTRLDCLSRKTCHLLSIW